MRLRSKLKPPIRLIPLQGRHLFAIAASALLVTGCGPEDKTVPPVLEALKAQGVTDIQAFDAGTYIRGFAGVVDGQPVAIYVTADGKAIVGTRIDESGRQVDGAALRRLAEKPLSEEVWSTLSSATWVPDGRADAPRVVYVFSDPNCPYCNRFWEAARPWVAAGKVQLRHLLVGVIKADSPAKASAILDAKDPSAALLLNEQTSGRGGIAPASEVSAAARRVLEDNQRLMLSLGFGGTPGILFKDGQGQIRRASGLPQQTALPDMFGPL